ncbi:hypothetical protein EJ08DRAFT_695378 [Tothia fuscella]|uniref:Uncharacterized protein n=1 Tax=Tothia fuscella TaxID=1048955 RepID=A0A9P4NUQ8_9PEZI|nr:hypothetical protein EJ08DRAFT_695378 [Tothia fuscella]
MIKTLGVFLLAAAIGVSSFHPDECPCYTATTALIAPKCAPLSEGCFRPACVHLSTTTIPGKNENCPATPTTTIIKPCPTKCDTGCGTFLETLTASTSCLASKSQIRYSPAPTITTQALPTPTSSANCYTWTTGYAPLCPAAASTCVTLNCIVFKTTTVPAVSAACPTTPTVTFTASCLPYCPGGCRTDLVPVAANPTAG